MNFRNIFLLLAFIVLFTAFANAQVYVPPPPSVPSVSNVIWNNRVINQIGIDTIAREIQSRARTVQTETRSGKKSSPNNSVNSSARIQFPEQLSFLNSDYSVLAQRVAQDRGFRPSSKEYLELQKFFGSFAAIYRESFSEENLKLQMPFNDIATAMTFYIISNYLSYHQLPGLPVETSAAVYKQVAPVFLNNQKILKMSESDKEFLHEVFVTGGVMPFLTQEATGGNQAKIKETCRQNLEKIFGQNVDRLKITNNGIEL